MNLLTRLGRFIGHEIHRPGPAKAAPNLPAAPLCPPTRAVHREREAAFRNTTADLLDHYCAARGHGLPAVERIIKGDA